MNGTADRVLLDALAALAPGSAVRVAGRISWAQDGRARLEDASGTATLAVRAAPLGAWVAAEGTWDGSMVHVARLDVLQVPRIPFPRIGGEWSWLHEHGRRRMRLLERRAAILRAIRSFFEAQGFLEVETPLAVPSPGLDLHLDAFCVGNTPSERWLITSPEYQMKRLLAGGLERIFQVCRCFRRGERGARHQPEFTMLEWYRALAGSDALMRDTEQLVAHVARQVLGTTRIVLADGSAVELTPPWERLRVEDAFATCAGISLEDALADEDVFYRTFAERIEPRLGRDRPVFLVEWPASMASLARLLPDRPDRADRFEAFVAGMELCNGFGELVDPVEQRARLERDRRARAASGRPVYPIDEKFLAALEEGVPPSGGNALGVDRLVMILAGAERIEDVVAVSEERL